MRVEAKDLKKTENTGTSFIRNSSFLNIKIQPLSPLRIKQSSLRNFPLINIIHQLYLIFQYFMLYCYIFFNPIN